MEGWPLSDESHFRRDAVTGVVRSRVEYNNFTVTLGISCLLPDKSSSILASSVAPFRAKR